MIDCDCNAWGQDKIVMLLDGHHPNCPKWKREDELLAARELIKELIDGMESWAADEDGIHPEAWDAYVKANAALGWRLKKSEA